MNRFVMTLVSVAASMALTSGRLSAEPEKNFEERKAEHLKDIDEKIQKMQEHRNCVASAAAKEELKKCRDAMRDFHKSEKMERLENRKKGLDKKLDELKK